MIVGLVGLGVSSGAYAADASPKMGIVDFAKCVTDSKQGKLEQASFDNLKNQLSGAMQKTEKELNEISAKFNDTETLDGLSPEKEEELKADYRRLSEEMSRFQNQYYQVLNSANMKIIQSLTTTIAEASEKVAKTKKLSVVLNKEACFYFSDELDVTASVISEMDKATEAEEKKQHVAA